MRKMFDRYSVPYSDPPTCFYLIDLSNREMTITQYMSKELTSININCTVFKVHHIGEILPQDLVLRMQCKLAQFDEP